MRRSEGEGFEGGVAVVVLFFRWVLDDCSFDFRRELDDWDSFADGVLVADPEVAVVVDDELEGAIEPAVGRKFTAMEKLLDWTIIAGYFKNE